MPNVTDDYQRVQPATRTVWRQWLATNHGEARGVWVVLWKKSSGHVGPSYEDVVEECLCVGWIDSRRIGVDEDRSALLCTPRKPRSPWADSNKERVRRLIDEHLMRPAGLAAIETAKRNGSWGAEPRVEASEVPADLARAIARNVTAQKHWDAFPAGVRKWFVSWVDGAKDPGTRMRRIEATVKQSKQNERPT